MPYYFSGYRNLILRGGLSIFLLLLISPQLLHSQVYISELMASNNSFPVDPDYGEYTDWIELYNSTNASIDLSGYYLSDDIGNLTMWSFQSGTQIGPKEYILINADGTGNGMHTNFSLAKGGEKILLLNPQLAIIDSISYPYQLTDISFGRDPVNPQLSGFFEEATPGAENGSQMVGEISPVPRFSFPGGFYQESITLNISVSNPLAEIYYTLNGKEPSKSSESYSGPINIDRNTIIRVKTYQEGCLSGPTVTQSYFINEPQNLPVISLVTDPDHLFSDRTGIYVKGSAGIPGNCTDVPHNLNQDWERPVNIELFEKNGTSGLNQLAGIKISGECTRTRYPIKSLDIYARKEYETPSFKYRLFPDKSNEEYEAFVLRAGGDDQPLTLFRDPLGQLVVKDVIDVDMQAYRPTVLYINGEYWGIHNLREKLNEHYAEDNFGVNPDSVELLKIDPEKSWNVLEGNADHYLDMINHLEENDITLQSNYEYMKSQMDMDQYINYQIIKIFFAARDWPGNNIKFWRSREAPYDRWRWILYDMDHIFRDYSENIMQVATDPNCGCGWPNPPWSTFLFRTLLKNEAFKQEFINRFSIYTSTYFAKDRLLGIINEMQAELAPEIPRHIERWGGQKITLPDNTWMYPIFNSVEQWEKNVQVLKDFSDLRPEIAMKQMFDYFGIEDYSDLQLKVEPAGMGEIGIGNTLVDTCPSTLTFENGALLNLTFDAKDGYKLSHWLVDQGVTENSKLISKGDLWSYFISKTIPDFNWTSIDYDDSHWESGNAQLGYGEGDEATVLSYGGNMADKFITTWFRKKIMIDESDQISSCTLKLLRDDGAILYLNGKELLRDNMPAGSIDSYTTAVNSIGGSDESVYDTFTFDPGLLRNGENVLAVEIHQNSKTSSDISFDLELMAGGLSQGNGLKVYKDLLEIELFDYSKVTAVAIPENELPQYIFINEVMASNLGVIKDEAGEFDDWIELYNSSNEFFDIAGLFLTDSLPDPYKYQIPQGSTETRIPPNGYLVLWADNQAEQGVLHLGFKLDRHKEEIGISKYGLGFIDSLSYSFDFPGASLGHLPDASGNLEYLTASPGASNHISLLENIYINEFMVSNTATTTDEYGECDDWIEIYNDNDHPVDIGGVFITDHFDEPAKHRIPPGQSGTTTIPAKGFLLLWADKQVEQGALHLDFKLNSEAEQIALVQQDGFSFIDSLSYENMATGTAFGRLKDGSNKLQIVSASPGFSNFIIPTDRLFISEIVASQITSDMDGSGVSEDWVEIYNDNNTDINIGGFYLTDNLDNLIKFRISSEFPDSTTIGAKSYKVFWADDHPEQGVCHLGFKLSGKSEQLGLVGLEGKEIIDSVSYPEQYSNFSYSRLDNTGPWKFLPPTHLSYNKSSLISGIFINELMASNSSVADDYGEFDDWIEIYNSNDYPVDIGGLYLSDSKADFAKHRIPSHSPELTTIPARGFRVLYADDSKEQGISHLNFKLKREGEFIQIINYDESTILDSISFPKQFKNSAFSRISESGDWYAIPPTPGKSNTVPDLSGLVINEVMANNLTIIKDDYNEFEDWIELYNSSNEAIDIGGLYISDSLSNPGQHRITSEFPNSTTIDPKGFFILWADSYETQGICHLNFSLAKTGESIGLFDYRKEMIDTISNPFISPNLSWGRQSDGDPVWRIFRSPSPLSSNIATSVGQETQFHNQTPVVYPNPVKEIAYLAISVEEPEVIQLDIFEGTGKLVSSWNINHNGSGTETFEWGVDDASGQKVRSGLYYCRIQTAKEIWVLKIMVAH